MGWIILGIVLGLLFIFVRLVKVEEGTARAVMVFGKFTKVIFQWEKHWLDTEWNIWREKKEGEKPEKGSEGKERKEVWGRIIGGLWVYFWPFQKIHHYKNRWTDIRIKENGKMELEFHEEPKFNHVLLKPAVYAIQLFAVETGAVETAPLERIPVDVLVLVTLRIENPYLFLFVAPPTPIEDVLARISASMRAVITSCPLDDLLKLKGESLWKEKKKKKEEKEEEKEKPLLRGTKVIEDTLEKWGMKLADMGIEIKEIDLPLAYQKAGAAKKEQEMKAGGRAEEIMGTVIIAVARAEGRPESEIQKEFRKNPEEFYKKHKTLIDNTMTKLSIEEKAYLRIETPGATGFGGEFLRLIGAWLRMPKVGPEQEPEKEGKRPKDAVPEEELKDYYT